MLLLYQLTVACTVHALRVVDNTAVHVHSSRSCSTIGQLCTHELHIVVAHYLYIVICKVSAKLTIKRIKMLLTQAPLMYVVTFCSLIQRLYAI
jgi:hypothetical protein